LILVREKIFVYLNFFLSIETLSPDLLDAYDAEYERICQLYEKRKPVLDAYNKWLSFWNDFVAFTVCYFDSSLFIELVFFVNYLESINRSWSFSYTWI
jgi:hypothetical protein